MEEEMKLNRIQLLIVIGREWLCPLFVLFLMWALANDAIAVESLDGEAGQRPPNVVFVLADDLGWAELGCYGNGFNETPNLDKLATQGMRFSSMVEMDTPPNTMWNAVCEILS